MVSVASENINERNEMTDEAQLVRLKSVLATPSFTRRKYGDGVRQQLRYLEGKKVVSSG